MTLKEKIANIENKIQNKIIKKESIKMVKTVLSQTIEYKEDLGHKIKFFDTYNTQKHIDIYNECKEMIKTMTYLLEEQEEDLSKVA